MVSEKVRVKPRGESPKHMTISELVNMIAGDDVEIRVTPEGEEFSDNIVEALGRVVLVTMHGTPKSLRGVEKLTHRKVAEAVRDGKDVAAIYRYANPLTRTGVAFAFSKRRLFVLSAG